MVVLAICLLISFLLWRTRRKYNAAKGGSTRESQVSLEQFGDDLEYDRAEAKTALKRLLLVDGTAHFPLELDKALDFGMEVKGSSPPKGCQVEVMKKFNDTVTITAKQDSEFFLVLPSSEKFQMLAQPKKGRIAKGESVAVKFQILVNCTTKIRAQVALARPGTGYIQLPLNMETMLSTRLDWVPLADRRMS